MKIRLNTLWRVPVYCIVSGIVSYFLTVYIGGLFYTVEEIGTDGVIFLSADPLRSALFNGALFLAVLFLGGFWAFRNMTRAEIGASAAIASCFYLVLTLAQMYIPGFPLALSMKLAYIQNWEAELSSLFLRLTGNFNFSVIAGNFAPILFVLFGKKE